MDVLAAYTYLKNVPSVDMQRIALFGSSYGAFLAARAASIASDRWCAAVLWGGFYDIPALFNVYAQQRWNFLTVEKQGPTRDWRMLSPISTIGHVNCPLLIIHGQNDTRCPIDQARRLRRALEESGKSIDCDFWYRELPQEGHVHTNINQSVNLLLLMADFFSHRGIIAR